MDKAVLTTRKKATPSAKPADLGRPLVREDDPRLFNMQELGLALGVAVEHIRKMKSCGFKMPLGRATVRMAHEWLAANSTLVDQDKG